MRSKFVSAFLALAGAAIASGNASAQDGSARFVISQNDMADLEAIFSAMPIDKRSELSGLLAARRGLTIAPECPEPPSGTPSIPEAGPEISITVLPDEPTIPSNPIIVDPLTDPPSDEPEISTTVLPDEPTIPSDPIIVDPLTDPPSDEPEISTTVLPDEPTIPSNPIIIDPLTDPPPEVVLGLLRRFGQNQNDPDDPDDPPEAFVEMASPPETWAEWQPPATEELTFSDSAVRLKFSNGLQTRTGIDQFLVQDEVLKAFQTYLCSDD